MIENIKSGILFILVVSSLLLTLALWNYQPAYEELGEPTYLDETRLVEGDTRQIDDVVYPKQILFIISMNIASFRITKEWSNYSKKSKSGHLLRLNLL